MPIQTYSCSACGLTFDRLLPRAMFDLRGPAPCPHCDTKALPVLNLPGRRNPAHGIQR